MRLILAAALAVLAAAAAPARAADPDAAFAEKLVEAINGKSLDQRRALLAAASRPCTTGAASEMYRETVTRQSRREIPANYRWNFRPLPAGEAPMFAEQFDYPVRPTHLLQIDFATGSNSSTTLLLQVVREGQEWREVVPCPRPETIAAWRAAEAERARHGEAVRALAASASPELRSAVRKLVAEGRRVDAITHYRAVTGQDLATAKDVVEILAR